MKKGIRRLFALAVILFIISACKITYSFSGTSIQADVETITVEPFVNRAEKVNPSLANLFTEELMDKYTKLTSLKLEPEDGHLQVYAEITSYTVAPTAVTSDEVASQNRLTINVKLMYTNRLHPSDNFENKTFSGYADYDAMASLDSVEATLCEEIVDKIVEDIFNATVANW